MLYIKCKPDYKMDTRVTLRGVVVPKSEFIECPADKVAEAYEDSWLILSNDGVNPISEPGLTTTSAEMPVSKPVSTLKVTK